MHGLRAGAGESMREFGTRTDGVEDEPGLASSLDAGDLADCSTASRERIWHEVRGALQIAAPVYEAGADEAAFRVLEGATLRLRGELDDCRAVLAALDEARVAARRRPNPTEAARVLGLSFEHVVDLLFARSEPAVVPRPARLPSTPVTG
jgi:hypothetical protein